MLTVMYKCVYDVQLYMLTAMREARSAETGAVRWPAFWMAQAR